MRRWPCGKSDWTGEHVGSLLRLSAAVYVVLVAGDGDPRWVSGVAIAGGVGNGDIGSRDGIHGFSGRAMVIGICRLRKRSSAGGRHRQWKCVRLKVSHRQSSPRSWRCSMAPAG